MTTTTDKAPPQIGTLDELPEERRSLALDLLGRVHFLGKAVVPSGDQQRAAAAAALDAAGLASVRAGRDFHVLTRARA